MKRCLVAIAFAASVIVGCQKTDIYYEASTKIEFVGDMKKQIKASGAAPSAKNDGQFDNLYAQDFRVWAFKNWDDPLTTNVNEINSEYDGITNLLISYKPGVGEEEGTWKTDKDYYWPGTDKSLKFYAISSSNWTSNDGAAGAETVSVNHTGNSTALGTMTISNFTVSSEADNDLMVADACIQMQQGSTKMEGEGDYVVGNAVEQTFRHALTKVRFNFITTSTSIPVFVQKIETSNLYNSTDIIASFGETVSFAWNRKSKTTFTDDCDTAIDFAAKNVTEVWQIGATTKTAVANLTDKDGITLSSTKQTSIDTWLMIPQSLSNATVTITYILKDRQFSQEFPLDITDVLTEWEPNQFVNYNVTIAPNLIDFDATVSGWNETDVVVGDSGSEVYNSVRATSNETAYTLFYKGELAVGTAVYIKDANGNYTAAAAADYLLEDGRTLKVAEGKVTAITE
jgi:hypothetical protein